MIYTLQAKEEPKLIYIYTHTYIYIYIYIYICVLICIYMQKNCVKRDFFQKEILKMPFP